MMKRTIIAAIAAAAALFALSSCQKETPVASISAENVEFNITVGDPAMYGEGTKAVRTSWEAGEQILLFLYPTATLNAGDAAKLKLTYDGSKWNGSMSDADFAAVKDGTYNHYDGIYFLGDITIGSSNAYEVTLTHTEGGPVAVCSGNYNLTESAGKFTFSANLLFSTTSNSLGTFQVVVPGISVSDGYKLYIHPNKDTATNGIIGITNVLYKGRTDGWGSNVGYFCNGIANADGVAYYPKYWPLRLNDATGYTFKLTNGSTTKYLYFDKDAGHTLANGKAIKLPNISSWSDTKPE